MKKTKELKNQKIIKIPSLKEIVVDRIDELIGFAIKIANKEPEYAIRYIKMARKLAMRNKIALGSKRKQLFCKNCNFPYIDNSFNLKITKNFAYFRCNRCSYTYKIHISKLIERYKK
ncbi:MAG: hypothetical protein NC918_00200 [Candidatus Omnitrophica bacterium]|nr:hypothetical protein [Candidatus Omnitrophota bacterium]